ncbi:E3 ubiquitin-protein ligase CCNB1IP1-like [Hydractinia symbiolongicarpus]|uniref:E3 ubiquitin-protein ligase CCNB1IP1-like n=1 Tax=Hydractinia symbiolongicarpus TaxID=13093 RepID=UPI0025507208|nr:E3 ubiquitin-protein ligase CCNB1IP1-like [Hydractinia symbiolongicarpus]
MAMVDNDLVCNFKKCRKRLVNIAWVTSCSHTFCDEDGTREFSKSFVCPACDTNLNGKHDIVRHELQPNEQYKSMILAGLKPEIIMEIASRAIAFWTYQAQQEKLYHEYASAKNKESRDKLEHYFEQLVNKLQVELKSVKVDLSAKSKELNETKRRFNELSEQHQEKSRQHQKLQIMYDTLRRRSINPASLEEENHQTKQPPSANHYKRNQFQMAIGSTFLGSTRNIQASLQEAHQALFHVSKPNGHTSPTPAGDGFVLKPYPTPVQQPRNRVEEHESFGQRFTLQLNTPRSK